MLRFEPADEKQYSEFLHLMMNFASDYLEDAMKLMHVSWERFNYLFRTFGEVYGIYVDGELAGFYWIEKRQNVLHLHALVLREEFQGRKIGRSVLLSIEERYRNEADVIELGVHVSNRNGISLYESLGYESVKFLEDLGFYIMQKRISD